MKTTKQILKLLVIALIIVSCNNDDSIELVNRDYSNGILISGEGSGAGTGSVTYLSSDQTSKYQFIYLSANGTQLGTYLQSMAFNENSAFIIVDNANTVTMVDKKTFIKTGEIKTDLNTPRFMTVVGDKGYITNWGDPYNTEDDYIAVANLNTNTVEKTISVANGPEQIVAKGNKLYVSHKGAYGTNNVVSVIDTATDDVVEITVKDNPDELLLNNNGDLLVLSEGSIVYDPWPTIKSETKAAIHIINTTTNTITKTIEFEEGEHPSLMTYDNGQIYYYLSGGVYKVNSGEETLPTKALISQSLYGMAVKNGNLYGVEANFTAQSNLYVFDLSTKEKVFTTKVALGASKIYFTE
ncbi:cell surface protein [Wenyingzhuangia sp. chi5]|uniref:Cell surface protein n=1 Tax=Wenyingzhuangia gilva TaxID=3057677 RepID=A0ABT8VN22_9FLAO|nr:DUF5074 domain-containing protein [Wenyingzhuangia sp. chi5]MDO3693361.1 cell surface protein [Wenyingzhuangia sp. chi5]